MRDHRRRRPARRQGDPAQGQCRCGARQARRRHRHRRHPHGLASADEGRPRRQLLGGARLARDRLRARGDGRRGPAVHPLHVGIDREAQGRGPHHRRLWRVGGNDLRLGVRLPAGRHLLVHRRRRLDHRPQLCRLRAARVRRDQRDVRRRPQLPRFRPVLGNRRPSRRQHILHCAYRDPGADARRRCAGEGAQAAPRCGCSAPSASRSTPRPGNGIGGWSATAAARWSTPGGRPRPAES